MDFEFLSRLKAQACKKCGYAAVVFMKFDPKKEIDFLDTVNRTSLNSKR